MEANKRVDPLLEANIIQPLPDTVQGRVHLLLKMKPQTGSRRANCARYRRISTENRYVRAV
jgi:hypothetical protein